MTMPGIIDTENGIIHRMPFYEDVKDVPLGEALANHTGVPVYIQHDISAWTMAESLFWRLARRPGRHSGGHRS
ncbi:transcriptional regulator Mic [Klebsiella pneumoniae]|uniref:Transcriptional regulator Mic n=1 Tax=Klebsiella pneumoniae TaxID=573 RepID=A0A2X3CP96_KLEPN|nr:transcriptional regulator Mic [Klebsiella pneumoniae]